MTFYEDRVLDFDEPINGITSDELKTWYRVAKDREEFNPAAEDGWGCFDWSAEDKPYVEAIQQREVH